MIEIHGGRGKVNIIDSLIKTYDIPNGFEMYIDNKVRLNITKINDYGEVFYVELPRDFDDAQEMFGNFRRNLSWLIFYAGDIKEEQKEVLSTILNTLERKEYIKQGILVHS